MKLEEKFVRHIKWASFAMIVCVSTAATVSAQSDETNGEEPSSDAATKAVPEGEDAEPTAESVEPEGGSESAESPSSPAEYCEEFVAAFARSSARKLYRALSGQGFDLKPIDLGDTITLDATAADGSRTTVTFDVLTENDELVAGIVDSERQYRRILVAAHTTNGPVVASQLWPTPTKVPTENACRPVDSQIAVPPLTLGDIDIEPFKFWGLRIVWRLPKGYKADEQGADALQEALTDALKQSIESN